MDSIYEQLVAEASDRSITADEAAYISALGRVAIAGKEYRQVAPMKDVQLEKYHQVMNEFDEALQALDAAAATIGKSTG